MYYNGFVGKINNYVLATTLKQMYIRAKKMRKIVLHSCNIPMHIYNATLK